jgi:hypothetical protein
MGNKCSISGMVFDSKSRRPILNEVSVMLTRLDKAMDPQVRFLKSEGNFSFSRLDPGEYEIQFGQSWRLIVVSPSDQPSADFLEGGYNFSEPLRIELAPGEDFYSDFYFAYYAHQSWTSSVNKPTWLGTNVYAFEYSRAYLWPVEENLLGKSMYFEVSWINTFASRIDLEISVLNHYNSTKVDYTPGSKMETLTIKLDEEFFKNENEFGHFLWRILVTSKPSPDFRETPIDIEWRIT